MDSAMTRTMRLTSLAALGILLALSGIAADAAARPVDCGSPKIGWDETTSTEPDAKDDSMNFFGCIPKGMMLSDHAVCGFIVKINEDDGRDLIEIRVENAQGEQMGSWTSAGQTQDGIAHVQLDECFDDPENDLAFIMEVDTSGAPQDPDERKPWSITLQATDSPAHNNDGFHCGSLIAGTVSSGMLAGVPGIEAFYTNDASGLTLTDLEVVFANRDPAQPDPSVATVTDYSSTFSSIDIDGSEVTLTGASVAAGESFWVRFEFVNPVAGDLGATITATPTLQE